VILEDDFELRGTLEPITDALAGQLRPWDMIKLGARKSASRARSPPQPPYRLVREQVFSKRTIGQIVSREGGSRLLARTLPICRPIDVQLQYPWELGIEVLTLRPSLVVARSLARFARP